MELNTITDELTELSLNGLKRNTIDKFYTKSDIVLLCLTEYDKYISINNNDLIIEPSAGNGSFSNILNSRYDCELISYDILPEKDTILKQDYLKLNIQSLDITHKNESVHIIGNPPFGRNSSMAKQFIKKSCEFCDTISFILPKSFKKESFQRVFPLNFHLISCINLPNNSFLLNGISYDVPCVFQIWRKELIDRDVIDIIVPTYYAYVKKEDKPDFSIRRVGVNAGIISKEVNKSIQSHYFIKLNDKKISIDKFIEKYNLNKKFDFDNTVGPRSISKQELNSVLVKLF